MRRRYFFGRWPGISFDLDFRGSAPMAQQLLGTEDLWENGAAMGNRLQLLLTPAQDRALETLRRQLLEPPRF